MMHKSLERWDQKRKRDEWMNQQKQLSIVQKYSAKFQGERRCRGQILGGSDAVTSETVTTAAIWPQSFSSDGLHLFSLQAD